MASLPRTYEELKLALQDRIVVDELTIEGEERPDSKRLAEDRAKDLYLRALYRNAPVEQIDFLYLIATATPSRLEIRLSPMDNIQHLYDARSDQQPEYDPEGTINGFCSMLRQGDKENPLPTKFLLVHKLAAENQAE